MYKNILKEKLIPNSLNNEVLDAVKAISYNINNVVYAGSYIRKSMRDSSDIDISENFHNKDDHTIATNMQEIIRKLLKTNYIILDIKSGIDPLYIDKFKHLGSIHKHKIINYNYELTLKDIHNIKPYINKSIFNDLLKSINKKFNLKDYFDFREKIRKLITLRWSADEILKGFKIIRNNKFYLYQAIPLFLTKIDIAFIYSGFYTELSNVFIVKSASETGLTFYPLTPQVLYFNEAIKYNLEEYLVNGYYLKALKRAYTLALFNKDNKLINKLTPIIASNIGILNKANSILKTIIYIVENDNTGNIDINEIKMQLNNLKPYIANIYQFNFNEKQIDAILDKLYNNVNLNNLRELSDMITNIINNETLHIIKEYKIKIPNSYFL